MKLPEYMTTVTTLSKTIALVLFIALPFIGFYAGMKYQKSFAVESFPSTKSTAIASTITPTVTTIKTENKNSEILKEDNEFNRYYNYKFGFSIKYPIKGQGWKCESINGKLTRKEDFVDYTIIEDLEKQVVHFVNKEYVIEKKDKDTKPISCESKTTDLKSITQYKNYFDLSMKTVYFISGFDFTFKNIKSDEDLVKLANEVHGPECKVNIEKKNSEISSVELKGNGYPNPCPLNYAYRFLYLSKVKLGITWSIGQQPFMYNSTDTYDGIVDEI